MAWVKKTNRLKCDVTRQYLGIWQLKDLKVPMSRADAAGSNVLVPNLELADAAKPSASMASLDPLEKATMKSPSAFVGEAKGLSGRLCSKLHLFINHFSLKRQTFRNDKIRSHERLYFYLKTQSIKCFFFLFELFFYFETYLF